MQPPVHQGAHICGSFINLRSPRTNKICIDHICSTRFISFVNHVIVLGMFTRFLSFIDDNIYRGPFLLVCIYCRNTLYVTAWFLRSFVSLPLYWSDECNSCLISACMYAAYKHVFLLLESFTCFPGAGIMSYYYGTIIFAPYFPTDGAFLCFLLSPSYYCWLGIATAIEQEVEVYQ